MLLQVLLQELNRQGPCLGSGLLIAHAMRWVEEGMTCLVHFDSNILAGILVHPLDLLDLLHGNPPILSTVESKYWNVDLCHLFRGGIIPASIEGDKRTEVRIASRDSVSQEATHAEAHESQLLGFDVGQGFDGIKRCDDLFYG